MLRSATWLTSFQNNPLSLCRRISWHEANLGRHVSCYEVQALLWWPPTTGTHRHQIFIVQPIFFYYSSPSLLFFISFFLLFLCYEHNGKLAVQNRSMGPTSVNQNEAKKERKQFPTARAVNNNNNNNNNSSNSSEITMIIIITCHTVAPIALLHWEPPKGLGNNQKIDGINRTNDNRIKMGTWM